MHGKNRLQKSNMKMTCQGHSNRNYIIVVLNLGVSHISILPTFSVIGTLMGQWKNLRDAEKINSKYLFFPKYNLALGIQTKTNYQKRRKVTVF